MPTGSVLHAEGARLSSAWVCKHDGAGKIVFNVLLHIFSIKILLRIQALESRSTSFFVSFSLILKALNLSPLELSS